MKTSSTYNPSQWHGDALQTLHAYTIRGAYPLVIGYPQHPEIYRLIQELKTGHVTGSVADCYTLPDYRAYIVVSHPEYKEQMINRILETIKTIRKDTFVIYKDLGQSSSPLHKAA